MVGGNIGTEISDKTSEVDLAENVEKTEPSENIVAGDVPGGVVEAAAADAPETAILSEEGASSAKEAEGSSGDAEIISKEEAIENEGSKIELTKDGRVKLSEETRNSIKSLNRWKIVYIALAVISLVYSGYTFAFGSFLQFGVGCLVLASSIALVLYSNKTIKDYLNSVYGIDSLDSTDFK